MEVRSDRSFAFDAPPARFWDAVGAVDRYRTWWPWLREFDAKGLIGGDRWHCAVKPPLPYLLRFTVTLDEVVEPSLVVARVSGDIEGDARLTIRPSGAGSTVRLDSALHPASPLLRVMGTIGRPLARYGHDWVLDVGARQFGRRAL